MLKKCSIVAEIGCTHIGQMERAKDLCKLARFCDADYVKLQKRNPEESTPKDMWHKPHPNQTFAYGSTYLEHRKNLEFTIEQHAELKEFCEKDLHIGYATSVWDITSTKEVVDLNPDFIKIGSPSNQNNVMIQYLFDNYAGGIHISLGMVTIQERQEIIDFVVGSGVGPERLVFYHCTSEYPAPFDRAYLNEISHIRELIPEKSEVGFSNHSYGIALDIAAQTMGVTWIERHFIDDRSMKHTDASFSCEPNGLRLISRNSKVIQTAMVDKPDGILGFSEAELSQRRKLKGR